MNLETKVTIVDTKGKTSQDGTSPPEAAPAVEKPIASTTPPPEEKASGTFTSSHPQTTRVQIHPQPEYEEVAPGVKIHKGGGPTRSGGTRVTIHGDPNQLGKAPGGTTRVLDEPSPHVIRAGGPAALPPPSLPPLESNVRAQSAALTAEELKKFSKYDLADAAEQIGTRVTGTKAQIIAGLVAGGFEGWEEDE